MDGSRKTKKDVDEMCWRSEGGQRNYWPKDNKTKKKGGALLLFIFTKHQ